MRAVRCACFVALSVVLGLLLPSATSSAQGREQHPRSTKLPPSDPFSGPYDIKGLGLGTDQTVVVTFASEHCVACVDAIPFYKTVSGLPGMDGKRKRVIVVATDGLWPVKDILDKHGFEPHRLTNGPYPARRLPDVKTVPTILLLDKTGTTVGKWEGTLSQNAQQQILAAITKGGISRKE